ncbi:hypothetical protein LX36DRAFT_414517 [Colletotrichum falcatum]|nr:hypothetical protein LX36DRAFT_414517 [Colletotrichum falcatum]
MAGTGDPKSGEGTCRGVGVGVGRCSLGDCCAAADHGSDAARADRDMSYRPRRALDKSDWCSSRTKVRGRRSFMTTLPNEAAQDKATEPHTPYRLHCAQMGTRKDCHGRARSTLHRLPGWSTSVHTTGGCAIGQRARLDCLRRVSTEAWTGRSGHFHTSQRIRRCRRI